MSEKPPRVRTPWKRWWQLFRIRCLPSLVWLGAVALLVTQWRGRTARVDSPGMFEARSAMVAPIQRGRIVSLAVDMFDEVRASQVVGWLDDSAVRAELAVAEAEAKRLEAELQAAERQLKLDAEQREVDLDSRARNYAMRAERLRLEKLDRMIELENDQVQLQGLAANLERYRSLRSKQVVDDQDYDDVRYQHDALQKKIAATKEALAVIEGRMKEAESQVDKGDAQSAAAGIDVALAPLCNACEVQLRRVEAIRVQRMALVLTAPLDGVVTAMLRREGETVMRGEPVLTVTDPRSVRIVSFVEQGKTIEPVEGMVVEVRRRTYPVQVARATVAKVSPQVEPIPEAMLLNPALRRWGVRVLIDVPADMLTAATDDAVDAFVPPRPGEQVDVRYFVLPQRTPRIRAPRGSRTAGSDDPPFAHEAEGRAT